MYIAWKSTYQEKQNAESGKKNSVKPYEFDQVVEKTERDITFEWLKNSHELVDPDELTSTLQQLKNIVQNLIVNMSAEEMLAWSNNSLSALDLLVEVVKQLALIYARGRPLSDKQELEDSEEIRKCLRDKLELAYEGHIKLFAMTMLDAIEGQFNLDDISYTKLGGFYMDITSGAFSFEMLIAAAYRHNRPDIIEKLAEMVEVDATTLEKWTHAKSHGILLLSLYRFKLLMDKKKLEIRMVYPGAKILALIISQRVRLNEKELEHYQQVLKHISSKVQQIPIDEIRKSAELLTSACAGNFDIPLSRDKSLVDSFSLFNILASMVIRKGDLDLLAELCDGIGKYRLFFIHKSFPVYSTMMDVLKEAPAGFDVERLIKIFMEHSSSCTLSEPPTINDVKCVIEPVIRLIPDWTIKPTNIDDASRKCCLCNVSLEPKAGLTIQEYQKLKEVFLDSVLRIAESKNSFQREQSMSSFKYIEDTVKRISRITFSGRPIVIDAMNLIHDGKSMNRHDRVMVRIKLSKAMVNFDALYRMIGKLKEMAYSPILVISHMAFPREHKDRLEEMDVMNLRVSGMDDDIFVMSAALMLGPRAHVLSNDAFRDHRQTFKSFMPVGDKKLFDVWQQSNFVNFAVYKNEVHMPASYLSGFHKDDGGYHIVPAGELMSYSWCFPSAQCIRMTSKKLRDQNKERMFLLLRICCLLECFKRHLLICLNKDQLCGY